MSPGDPTDNALAAIASILDQPETRREPERPVVDERPTIPPPLPPDAEAQTPIQPHAPVEVHAPIEADGYSRVGPGPMAAIRFKWTVRADNGEYYVDETIGENSTPMVSGPMGRDAAVRMVHEREAAARLRFEQLKSEMTGRGAAANLVRGDRGEA